MILMTFIKIGIQTKEVEGDDIKPEEVTKDILNGDIAEAIDIIK